MSKLLVHHSRAVIGQDSLEQLVTRVNRMLKPVRAAGWGALGDGISTGRDGISVAKWPAKHGWSLYVFFTFYKINIYYGFLMIIDDHCKNCYIFFKEKSTYWKLLTLSLMIHVWSGCALGKAFNWLKLSRWNVLPTDNWVCAKMGEAVTHQRMIIFRLETIGVGCTTMEWHMPNSFVRVDRSTQHYGLVGMGNATPSFVVGGWSALYRTDAVDVWTYVPCLNICIHVNMHLEIQCIYIYHTCSVNT